MMRTKASTRCAVESPIQSDSAIGPPLLGSYPDVTKEGRAMQVSRTNELKGGRAYYSIGRIKASSAGAQPKRTAQEEPVWRPSGCWSAKRKNFTPTQLSI